MSRLPPEQDLKNAPRIIIELTAVDGVVNKILFENGGENSRLRRFNFTHIIQRAQHIARSANAHPEKLKAIREKRTEIEAEAKKAAEEEKISKPEVAKETTVKPEVKKATIITSKKTSKGAK